MDYINKRLDEAKNKYWEQQYFNKALLFALNLEIIDEHKVPLKIVKKGIIK